MKNPNCSYCGLISRKTNGTDVYPKHPDLAEKIIYKCDPCDAYVGCHPGTDNPLGRLANKELRYYKIQAHSAFDPIWKSRKISRREAYNWLAKKLEIHPNDCHIGMFDVYNCKMTKKICEEYFK